MRMAAVAGQGHPRNCPGHKTAPAPPAVRAPVFPQSLPGDGRLEVRSPLGYPKVYVEDLSRSFPYELAVFVIRMFAICKKCWHWAPRSASRKVMSASYGCYHEGPALVRLTPNL